MFLVIQRCRSAIDVKNGGSSQSPQIAIELSTSQSMNEPSINVDHRAMTAKITRPIDTGWPVYYVHDREQTIVGDHLSVFSRFGYSLEVDDSCYGEFLANGYVYPPNTLVKGVRQLFPGQELAISWVNSTEIAVSVSEPMKGMRDAFVGGSDPSDLHGALLSVLLVGMEGKVGDPAVLLSGGVDSTILFCMAKQIWDSLRCFSTSYWFDELDDQERFYATTAAKALAANHMHDTPSQVQFLKHLILSIHSTGMPVVRLQSALMHALLSKPSIAANFVICGQGADAVFGLEHHFRILAGGSEHAVIGEPGRDFLQKFLSGGHDFGRSRDAFVSSLAGEFDEVNIATFADLAGGMATTQAEWSMIGASLGRSLFYPFLHAGIREYAAYSLREEKFSEPKALLRNLARRLGVPELIVSRRKLGFGPTRKDWVEMLLPLIDVLEHVDVALFKEAAIEPETRYVCWNVITYAIWKEVVLHGRNVDNIVSRLKLRSRIS